MRRDTRWPPRIGHVRGGFATCLVLRLGIDGACLLGRAGHLARFLNEHELDLPPTLPLGVVDAAEYAAIPLHLAAGDRLALYTDGLVEARNASGELLGFDWTRNLLTGNLDAHAAVAAAVAFGQDDDMTVLILTRDAAKPERAGRQRWLQPGRQKRERGIRLGRG